MKNNMQRFIAWICAVSVLLSAFAVSAFTGAAVGEAGTTAEEGVGVTASEATTSASEYLLGDVDGNGKITSADARLALKAAARLEILNKTQSDAADYDRSGELSASDARFILRVAAKQDPFAPPDTRVHFTTTTVPPTTTAPPTTVPPTTKAPEPQKPAKRQFTYAPMSEFGTKYGFAAGIYDYDHDKILYGKNMDSPVEPASTTKLMTAYVASKYLKPDSVITVGAELNLMDWNTSKAGIYKGLRMTFSEMLKCLLLPSGCDAAYAIAAAASKAYCGDPNMDAGSAIATFVSLMNIEAKEMGMTHSRWTNPDGFPNKDRPYTTAHDMLICGAYAYSVPVIRETVKLRSATAYTVSGKAFSGFTNTNELLNPSSDRYYRYCVGMKTGSHSTALQCLVSAAVKDGRTFIAVVYRCPDKYARYYALTSMFNTAFRYCA